MKTTNRTKQITDISICDTCKWKCDRPHYKCCDFPLMAAIIGEDMYNLSRSECKFYESKENINDNKLSKQMLIDVFSTELKKFDS